MSEVVIGGSYFSWDMHEWGKIVEVFLTPQPMYDFLAKVGGAPSGERVLVLELGDLTGQAMERYLRGLSMPTVTWIDHSDGVRSALMTRESLLVVAREHAGRLVGRTSWIGVSPRVDRIDIERVAWSSCLHLHGDGPPPAMLAWASATCYTTYDDIEACFICRSLTKAQIVKGVIEGLLGSLQQNAGRSFWPAGCNRAGCPRRFRLSQRDTQRLCRQLTDTGVTCWAEDVVLTDRAAFLSCYAGVHPINVVSDHGTAVAAEEGVLSLECHLDESRPYL